MKKKSSNPDVLPEAIEKNPALQDYLQKFLQEELPVFLSAKPEPRAIRANTLKRSATYIRKRLQELGVPFESVPFNPNGFTLLEDSLPLSHTLDFFCGYFQYQGLASQIPPLVLNPSPGERVLDMAASPGSKATQIAALMQNQGLLYVNDVSARRVRILSNNLQKAGSINNILTLLPGERFGNLLPEFFDKILLDAPCTALGTLTQNPEIASWWGYGRLQKIVDLQKRLFISAYKALKVGGELVYSTCSIAPEENELLIDEMLRTYPMEIIPIKIKGSNDFSAGLTTFRGQKLHPDLQYSLRILPHLHGMEGFFIVKLRKLEARKPTSGASPDLFYPTTPFEDASTKQALAQISQTWGISETFWQNYRYLLKKDRIWILNRDIEMVPTHELSSAGLLLAEKKRIGWKLFNQSVQFLESQITNRRISLSGDQLVKLFAAGQLAISDFPAGYYVLIWDDIPRGSLYSDGNQLKIKLPHKFGLIL